MVGRIFLGRYETIRLLGEGGMGRVYLARQIDLGRQVVVKVMHDHIASDAKFRQRFQGETLLMARFQHPYVVTLYDASVSGPEGPCIVMEYVKGVTLDMLLRRNTGRLTPQRVARLLGQLCEALQAAHSEGIIHRDLKPANVMVVDADTPYEKIKVMDFGLAKDIHASSRRQQDQVSRTDPDFAVGTPGYISPEQVHGYPTDHRSDLYSVGVMLYELLTGRLPFTGNETMDVLLAHATKEPPSFADAGLSGVIPPAIEAVVLCCLAKNPDERPQSARDLAELYEQALYTDDLAPEAAPCPTPVPGPLADGAGVRPRPPATTPVPAAAGLADADPNVVVHQIEAWMPEAVASYKLRGFIFDAGGTVVESVPGRIRVRLGGKGSTYGDAAGPLSWLGLGRKGTLVDMEMRLERNNPAQQSLLTITVLMRSPDGSATSPAWRARCGQIFCDLRGYLMGSGISASS